MVTVVKQWVQLWDTLLHKYGLNCQQRIVWFSCLPNNPPCSQFDWCKFCVHLRSLNVIHFGMYELKDYGVEKHYLLDTQH
jgi:hypothetical protein